MGFIDDARSVLKGAVLEIEERTEGYVSRTLVRQGISLEEAAGSGIWQWRRTAGPGRELLDDAQITDCQRLAIVGDAGSGKSYILQKGYLKCADAFPRSPDAAVPFFLDLYRHLSGQHTIEEAVNRRCAGLFHRVAAEHEPGCVLFLDGLDDRLLGERNHYDFVNKLLFFLEDHRRALSCVVLACRRAVWNRHWFRDSTIPWEVYQADYLDLQDYAAIIPDPDARAEFFRHADSLRISDLLRLPFIGFDLARRYHQGEELPTSRQHWFRERIETGVKETGRDRERSQAPGLGILLNLSRQLACLATFGRVSGWTVQEAVDQLGASEVLRDQLGFVAYDQVDTLFQRPLFTKTDERFSFSHQLFREWLAADALRALPLRKQRQLLETPFPRLHHRVLTPYRGVAVFLAEMAPRFCAHLIENDPLLAFLAEIPSLPPESDEQLTKAVIDLGIATHRPYWWEIPPRGERPFHFLGKHRPRDVGSFVRPYLERRDEMALLWATGCVHAWGGCRTVNRLLIDLAHSDAVNVQIRKNAVDAVWASGEQHSIRELYDLLDSKDDEVRGHVLYAYRMTESPSPSEYMAKLHGGAHDESLHCQLQQEASSFGLFLNKNELEEAFQQVSSHSGELGNLRCHVLGGLFRRAIELEFEDIPAPLIVNLWLRRDTDQVYYEQALKEVVSGNPRLFSRVWNSVMERLGQGNPELAYSGVGKRLAEVCDDQVFDFIPADTSALNWDQDRLLHDVLWRHFSKQPTAERLQVFNEKAPAFTAHFRPPQPALEPPRRDRLESRRIIADVLNREELSSVAKASRVLGAIARILHGNERSWVQPEEVIDVLNDLSPPLQKRVVGVFEGCVSEIEYRRTEANEINQFTITRPRHGVPFWVLWQLGFKFTADKLDEFIRCYGFSGVPHGDDTELYFPLLDKLHNLYPERWSQTVGWLVDFSPTIPYGAVQYLIAKDSDVYLERCRERLSQSDFDAGSFYPLLDYWAARRPSDFEQVLQTCHRSTDDQSVKTVLLYTLLTEDNDWAWDELHRRVHAGDAPLTTHHISRYRPLRLPLNPLRLPALADWYASVRRERPGQQWPGDLGHVLLEVIVRIGGEGAIQELQRLQHQRAFPGAAWLSHAILRVEDQMLGSVGSEMEPGQLIDFVNREALGVVRNEHDLFEWVCQAIESVKESLEGPAHQVHGYWNRRGDEWCPKTEPECQNVLWPAVRSRLSNLGIVGVEEKLIRRGKADFWVEKPLKGEQPLRVGVELKVARKGYGPARLVAPVKTQLWKQYLQPSGCQHGIYIVLWFKDPQRYLYPTGWTTPQELNEQLSHYGQEVSAQHHIAISCYVIDMTTPMRLH